MNFRLGLSAIALVFAWRSIVDADYLEVRRSAILKVSPESEAAEVIRPEIGSLLTLLESDQTDGYYHAQPLPSGTTGWIYRTLVRRYPGNPPGITVSAPAAPPAPATPTPSAESTGEIRVASFNIKFLGLAYQGRDYAGLASIIKDEDIVVIQELVAPPFEGTFPDGTPFKPKEESAKFFQAMAGYGYSYVLSEEDTGKGEKNHTNASSTEWWVAFYRPSVVSVANDLPHGFLAEDRTKNDDYDRVPYAFAFRSTNKATDFVLVSVHLRPSPGSGNAQQRKHELASVAEWVDAHSSKERDFLILGDMNIQNCDELADTTPSDFSSMNSECLNTNTNVNGPKPYDHVMYRADDTEAELDLGFGFHVLDLIAAMRPLWKGPGPYPGGPLYDQTSFETHYSDHNPVEFRFLTSGPDDD